MSAACSPWLSTAGWIPRASSRSSSSDWESSSPAELTSCSASAGSRADAALDHPQLERDGDEPLLRAVVEVALEPPPLRVAGGDDALARGAQLREPVLGLGLQPRVVERDRGRGGDGLDELRIVVERRVVDEHPELAAVALDRRRRTVATRRGQRDRLSAAVDVGALARHAIGQDEPWIAERLGEPRLQPHAAQRAELAEEIREPSAREPGAQQAPEQRGRDREQRRVQDPEERDHGRARRAGVVSAGGVQHAAQAPAQARQQRSPARPRGRTPARADHERDARATRRSGRPAGPSSSALAISASGRTSSRLSSCSRNSITRELEDEEADEEHPDEHAVDGRDEPAAGHEAQDQRGEDDDPHLADQRGERERQRRVDLARGSGPASTPKPASGQQAADGAVGAPPPGDEAARREGDAGERVDHVVPRHRRTAVEEHRDQRDEARRRRPRPTAPARTPCRACGAVR